MTDKYKLTITDFNFKNITDALTIHAFFFIIPFIGVNIIDRYLKKVFNFIEETSIFKYFLSKDYYSWILFKVIVQLLIITTFIALVKKFIRYVFNAHIPDQHVFGSTIVLVSTGFISFFSQDNLKLYLKQLNDKLNKNDYL